MRIFVIGHGGEGNFEVYDYFCNLCKIRVIGAISVQICCSYLRSQLCTYRREGPARAALALILDRGNGSLGPPDHAVGDVDVFRGNESGSSKSVAFLQVVTVSVHRMDKFMVKL